MDVWFDGVLHWQCGQSPSSETMKRIITITRSLSSAISKGNGELVGSDGIFALRIVVLRGTRNLGIGTKNCSGQFAFQKRLSFSLLSQPCDQVVPPIITIIMPHRCGCCWWPVIAAVASPACAKHGQLCLQFTKPHLSANSDGTVFGMPCRTLPIRRMI